MKNLCSFPFVNGIRLPNFFFFFLLTFIAVSDLKAQPAITSFSPLSGTGGTTVTITGSGFNTTAASNVVFLGSAPADVVSVNGSGTELTITTPAAGANYGQITVINTGTGLSAVSREKFVYTFPYGVNPSAAMNSQFSTRNTMTGPDLTNEYNDTWSCRTSVSGDFDKDGKIDFAARNSIGAGTKTMYIYKNVTTAGAVLNSSSFTSAATVTLQNTPIHVYPFPADMDNDGKLDILIGSTTANYQILQNTSTGPGNFGFTNYSFNTSGGAAETLTVGDFNGDGLLDIAAFNSYTTSTTLYIYLNTTSGGVLSFNTTPTSITMPSKMGAIFTADIDSDGDKDILAMSRLATSPWVEKLYYVINNSSGGSLSMGAPVTLGTMGGNSYYPAGLTAGDLDDDGDEDIAVALRGYNATDSCIWVFRNDGALSFSKFAVSDLLGTANNAVNVQMRIVDMNGDGKKDLLWSQTGNGRYYCVFSQHPGGPLNPSSFAGNSIYNTSNFGFSIDDFNQDGKVDIVEPTYFSSTLGLITNINTVYYCKSSGDLSLAATWNTQLNGSGANASSLTDATKTYILANRSSYTLSGALTINNLTLDNGKTLDLGNYNLTVTAGISGATATTYIKTSGTGTLTSAIASTKYFTFPVGLSAYNPVTITNRTGASANFSVGVLDAVYVNGTSGTTVANPHVGRTWNITTTASGGSGVDLTFNWNNGEVVGDITSKALYHHNGTYWELINGTTSSGTNSFTYTGYTGSFSPFTVGDGILVLPVLIKDFAVSKTGKSAFLQWTSLTEKNSSVFIVQHSTDGLSWNKAGEVSASGNSSSAIRYQFTHNNPGAGMNYYRLLIKDTDNQQSFSKIVSILFGAETQALLYPNPVVNGFTVLRMPAAGQVLISNSAGVLVKRITLPAGDQVLDLSGLPEGVYQLRVPGNTIRFVIQ